MTMAPAKSRFCPIATEPDCRLVDERRIADWPLEIGIHQIMTTRTLLKRLEKVEEALKAQSIFSQDCICFPETEQPFFCSPSEEPVAAKVKCPLHGNRFNHELELETPRDRQATVLNMVHTVQQWYTKENIL
jgi:hypothetical protein